MTATLRARSAGTESRRAGPAIRVRPAPRSEPLTDDEILATGWQLPPMNAPTLPLDLALTMRSQASPSGGARPLAMGAAAGPTPAPAVVSDASASAAGIPGPATEEPQEPTLAPQPPARLAVQRFVRACVEVVGGFRPVTHLRTLCRPDRFAIVAERLTGRTAFTPAGRADARAHFSARTPVVGRLGTSRPPSAGRAVQSAPGDRLRVARIQLCEPVAGVAEVAVVLSRRDHVWAMALRLEHRSGRWLCTHLEVL